MAQKAATVGVLSGGRFTLGLSAGENLNEHVVGGGWPSAQPGASLVQDFDQAGGTGKPKYGQLAVCYDPDVQAARARARRLWRWAAPGWPVTSELPEPRAFDAASSRVREEDIAALVPCGPDPAVHVRAARRFAEAGFTHLALIQVGGEQQGQFIAWAKEDSLPALRAAG
jgi:G6PDH family F420-dependent oxidoreductase